MITAEECMNNNRPDIALVKKRLDIKELTLNWLAGDGSDRCYFRVTSPELRKPLVIMMLAESEYQLLKDERYDWLSVAEDLRLSGIRVPGVEAIIPENGLVIIEDYGNVMLESQVLQLKNRPDFFSVVEPMYLKCADILVQFLDIPKVRGRVWTTREFDAEKLSWELRFFQQMFFEKTCHYQLTRDQQAKFNKDTASLSNYLSKLPQVFTHRDFHSRNIMIVDNDLAVIDFQDSRLGPAAYDLVSLVFDSYAPFTIEQRVTLLNKALGKMRSKLSGSDFSLLEESIEPMLIQRQIKAIGSFGYLATIKNKRVFLSWVSTANQVLKEFIKIDDRWPFLSEEIFEIIDQCNDSLTCY